MTELELINWLREAMGRDADIRATVNGVMKAVGADSFGDFIETHLGKALELAEGLKDMEDQDEELNDIVNAYKEVEPRARDTN